ncbi:MAG: peptidoglycan bridge formation glycyltransferase FemA/FemB family protein, partial [Erysipelotrichaceae bacterium]
MNFIEINEDRFQTYASQHPLRTFLQTKNMGSFQQSRGQRIYYLAVEQNQDIVAAGVFMGAKTNFGYYYSCPCGFLMDYHDKALLSFYTAGIQAFLKSKDGYLLNIEPEILYQERNIDGKIVEGGFNNQSVVDNLIDCGYAHNGF